MQSRAAIRYAKAIYEIALDEYSIKELYNDMDIIKSIYFDSLDFKNLKFLIIDCHLKMLSFARYYIS